MDNRPKTAEGRRGHGRMEVRFTTTYEYLPSLKWENQRQNRESFRIRELQTLQPEGINKKGLNIFFFLTF
jgi:hypothetical protein